MTVEEKAVFNNLKEDFKSFIRLTKKTRDAQCNYFKTRDKADLLIAKEIEVKLDNNIIDYKDPTYWKHKDI